MSKYEHTECPTCGAGLSLDEDTPYCVYCRVIDLEETVGRQKHLLSMIDARVNTYGTLIVRVLEWAWDRGILQHSTPQAQLLKALSEMGELADAVIKNDKDGVRDAVGDTLVCLINFCEMMDLTIYECLATAWDQIKHRKGHMIPGGAFVKEEVAK